LERVVRRGKKQFVPRPESEWVRVEKPELRIIPAEVADDVQGQMRQARDAYARLAGDAWPGTRPRSTWRRVGRCSPGSWRAARADAR
jgi:hypothetical protein